MRRKLRILFTGQPEDMRYIEGTHTKVVIDEAVGFISEGLARPYDQNVRILGEDCPERATLFDNRIYTISDLEDGLPEIEKYDGIGPVTARKLEEYIEADRKTDSPQADE